MTPDQLHDERWMRQALMLARRGQGAVEPNPMVGAVVLTAGGALAGEGYHERFGGPHAEINALTVAGERARGGTLYVTLEPCCHFGKTPPCTDSVLRSGVQRVVVGMQDPFPAVAGNGIALLREAGLKVSVGMLEAEAMQLNAPYLKRIRSGQPWVIAKWAMSLDGKIATRCGDSKWVSGEQSREKVHELRGRMDAIITGRGTVIADDPLLTARPAGQRTPTRVVITSSGELPTQCQLVSTARDIPVLVYTTHRAAEQLGSWVAAGATVVSQHGGVNGLVIGDILSDLGHRKMTNVLVEGGPGILGEFLDSGSIDEVWVFIAPKLVGGSLARTPIGGIGVEKIAEALVITEWHTETLGNDILIRGFVKK